MPNDARRLFDEATCCLEPSISGIEAFCRLIDPTAAHHCIVAFDDSPAKDKTLAGYRHGRPRDLIDWIKEKQKSGCGIFIPPNYVPPGKRRRADNVERVRAGFSDSDEPEHANEVEAEVQRRGLLPSIVVESSPGRHHRYWLTDDCPLPVFKPMQKAIAAALGTDPVVSDLSRVMRLPGTWHLKAWHRGGGAFMVRLISSTGLRHPFTDILRAYSIPNNALSDYSSPLIRRAGSHAQPNDTATRLRFHLDRLGGLLVPAIRVAILETRHGARHSMLCTCVARLVGVAWTDPDVRALVLPAAFAAWPDVDPHELTARVNNLLAWTRRQEAPKLASSPPMSERAQRALAGFGGGRRAKP